MGRVLYSHRLVALAAVYLGSRLLIIHCPVFALSPSLGAAAVELVALRLKGVEVLGLLEAAEAPE